MGNDSRNSSVVAELRRAAKFNSELTAVLLIVSVITSALTHGDPPPGFWMWWVVGILLCFRTNELLIQAAMPRIKELEDGS